MNSPAEPNSDPRATLLEQRLDALEGKLSDEINARSLEIATQEHRLLPALTSWLKSIFQRPFDHDRFVACSYALAWCLIPQVLRQQQFPW